MELKEESPKKFVSEALKRKLTNKKKLNMPTPHNLQSNVFPKMDLASIEKDFISKRVYSSISYLQTFFDLTPDSELWCVILQVLKDVKVYFSSLSSYAQVEFIQDTLVSYISEFVWDIIPPKSFLDQQEKEWLYFSYSTRFCYKMHYSELLDVFSEHNGYTPNNVTTDSEKRSYFKTLDCLVSVEENGDVQPCPMKDLMLNLDLNKDVFKYYGLEKMPLEVSNNVTLVEQNRNKHIKRVESTVIWCADDLIYKKLYAIVQLLLRSFGSLSCGHLKKCITYVWSDIKVFLDQLSIEKQSEVFASISATMLKSKDLYLLPPTKTYTFEWGFGSKHKLCVVHIVCNLALHGETNCLKLLKDFYSTAPEANIFCFTPKDPRWYVYFKRQSKFWELTEHNSLKLPSSFCLTTVPKEDSSLTAQKHFRFQRDLENVKSSIGNISLHAKDPIISGAESKQNNQRMEHSASQSSTCDEDAMFLTNIVLNGINNTYPSKSTNTAVGPNGYSKISKDKAENCPNRDLVPKFANTRNTSQYKLDCIPENSISKLNAINDKALFLEETRPSEVNATRGIVNPSKTVKTETVYPQDKLNHLSQSLQGCIAHLLQFFELNLNSGFFEVVLQVLNNYTIFSNLLLSQQQEVVKASFQPFHVDQQGRVIAVPSKAKECTTSENLVEIYEMLCVLFIIRQQGEQHFSKILAEYKVHVGRRIRLKPFDAFGYFGKRKDLFEVASSGFVHLLKTPSMEWDYVSFVVSEHRQLSLRLFNRIKESAILLGKSFKVVSEEKMTRTILYILKDVHGYLVTESDYHKSILKEMCSYYESKKDASKVGETNRKLSILNEEEKDLLVLACVLVSFGAMHCDKLFNKLEAHGRTMESTVIRNLRRSFKKKMKRDIFAVDHLKNVSLSHDSTLTTLDLDAFFKAMDLKASFQSALFSGSASATVKMKHRKFKSSIDCVQKNALCVIYDVCSDVLSSKAEGNMSYQCKEMLQTNSNTKLSFESRGAALLNATKPDSNSFKAECLTELSNQKYIFLNNLVPLPKFESSEEIKWGEISPSWGNGESSNVPDTSAENETNVFYFGDSGKKVDVPSQEVSSKIQPFLSEQQDVPGSFEAIKTDEFKFHIEKSSKHPTTYQNNLLLSIDPHLVPLNCPMDDVSNQSNCNHDSLTSVAGTFMNDESLHTRIFEEDKSYYNDLIDSFLAV